MGMTPRSLIIAGLILGLLGALSLTIAFLIYFYVIEIINYLAYMRITRGLIMFAMFLQGIGLIYSHKGNKIVKSKKGIIGIGVSLSGFGVSTVFLIWEVWVPLFPS